MAALASDNLKTGLSLKYHLTLGFTFFQFYSKKWLRYSLQATHPPKLFSINEQKQINEPTVCLDL